MARRRLLLSIAAVVALSGCDGGPAAPDGGPSAPGACVLEGEAARGDAPPRTERLVLFVPEAGSDAPMYLRNTRWSTMAALTFAEGSSVSEPIGCGCELCDGTCTVRVEADTRCAVFEYTDYVEWGPSICQDGGEQVTGTLRACPTGEAFVPELVIEGTLEPSLIDLDGRVSVRASYPLEPAADPIEVRIDGAPHEFTATSVAPDRLVIELGTIAPGTDVAITYAGDRPVSPTPPTAFATTASITDLTLETEPPDGAIDARGQPVRFEAGALHIDDEGHCPRAPFAAAIALGDPGSAAALAIDHEHGERMTSYTEARLVRADGSSGAVTTLRGDPVELPVPAGAGAVWLLLTNEQSIPAPHDYADPAVLRIDALEWR